MKGIVIPAKMARRIINTEELKEVFDQSKECLVATGAKLFFRKNRYYLSGYAQTGHDVDHYTKMKWTPDVIASLKYLNRRNWALKLVLHDNK